MLMFAGALVAWTGVVGPANPTTLKEQPLMAALIALAAGALAYRAAMAKVYEDRERERRDLDRRRVGIYLRLGFAINLVLIEGARTSGMLTAGREFRSTRFKAEGLRFKSIDEINEAWQNVELLPLEVSAHLHEMRSSLFEIDKYLTENSKDGWIDVYQDGPPVDADAEGIVWDKDRVDEYIMCRNHLLDAANAIQNEFEREISKIKNVGKCSCCHSNMSGFQWSSCHHQRHIAEDRAGASCWSDQARTKLMPIEDLAPETHH